MAFCIEGLGNRVHRLDLIAAQFQIRLQPVEVIGSDNFRQKRAWRLEVLEAKLAPSPLGTANARCGRRLVPSRIEDSKTSVRARWRG